MKKLYGYAGVVVVVSLIVPFLCLGATGVPKQIVVTGVVNRIVGNQLTFSTPNAATYRAETSSAKLTRKYGAAMNFDEIITGDKIEVTGMVWPDNSINASLVKNLSLYVHNSTFVGKIGVVDVAGANFTLESKTYGSQTIHINNLTVVKKNGSASSLAEMKTGMGATVKGIWERDNKNIAATEVKGILRLVNISFSGRLVMVSPIGFTVVGANNAMYAVDFSGAQMLSKNGKGMGWGEFKLDDKVSVQGKHISGQLQIQASLIKDSSVIK